jgi:hypothetical protein
MTLDASGNLLVGTTAGGAKVKLALTSPGTLGTVVNVGSFGSSAVLSIGGATNNTDGVYFGTGDTLGQGVASGIGFLREAVGWNSALAFYTNNVTSGPNGTAAITERMRLDSSGNLLLGFGGTSTTAVASSKVGFTNTANPSSFDVGLLGGATDSSAFIYQRANSPLIFGTNNTERIRITQSGALAFAGASNYGSSGQILQSNGDAAPTWVNASSITSGSASLTGTYVGFGSGSNTLTGSSNLTWNGSTLSVTGSIVATTKSFLITHPTKSGMKLRYGSLEGPENGVYVRGKLTNNNIIELPDYWTGLVNNETITVNLTSIGQYQKLYIKDISNNKVIVGIEDLSNNSINCFYTVWAERKDVDKLVVEF